MIFFFLACVLVAFGAPIFLAILAHSNTALGAGLRRQLRMPERRRVPLRRRATVEREREASARQMAATHGMRYLGDSSEELDRLRHFRLLAFGPVAESLEDVIVGEARGVREALSHYARKRSVYTFAHFTSSQSRLPAFRVTARDFDRIDRTSPALVLVLADVPAFAAQYEVRGEDEAQLRRLFDRNVREFLAARGGLWIEGEAAELLCASDVDHTGLAEREAFFATAQQLHSVLAARSLDLPASGGAV